MKELLYIAGNEGDKYIIRSTRDASKCLIATRNEMYKISCEFNIGGEVNGHFYCCLFSSSTRRWYTSYYRKSQKCLLKLHKDGRYTEMFPVLSLSVCRIFLDGNMFISINDNDAYVQNLNYLGNGFSGRMFDSLVWDHKLFLHMQTVKLFNDGLYFVNNYVGILKNDLSLYCVHSTNMSNVTRFERKYKLKHRSSHADILEQDKPLLETLQLFNLHKSSDGVYLDNYKIYG